MISLWLFYGFIFSGVDGFSIDITTMVDIRDQTNKELAMRLVTDIQNEDVFYTDLNGFQVSANTNKTNLICRREVIKYVGLRTK